MFKDYMYYIGFQIHEKFCDWKINKRKQKLKCENKEQHKNRRSKRGKYLFRKSIVLIAAVLWLIAAGDILWGSREKFFLNYVTTGSSVSSKESNRIVSAFENMSFQKVTAGISTYAKYSETPLTDTAKNIILEQIAETIGIDRYSIQDTIEDENEVKTLSQNSVNGDVICKFITVDKSKIVNQSHDISQYIYIGITLNNTVDAAFTYEKIVKSIVKDLKMDATVTVNLKGEINGCIQMDERNKITDMMLDKIKAKVVAERKNDELYTVYAYDKEISDYIMSVGKKVNVNISMNYDEQKNVTNVYYSTPINNQDY